MKEHQMRDHLIIATAAEDTIRLYAALTTRIVDTARQIHDTWPTATAAFGRALTATLLMGVMADNLSRLTVSFACDGPVEKIVSVSNEKGTVKGYLGNPHVHFDLNSRGKLDVKRAVGSGQVIVVKDIGLKEPYQGITPIVSGEIGEDIAHYFVKSEQIPSAVSLGVLVNPNLEVKVAGGFIVQLMPGHAPDVAENLEKKLARMPSLTKMLAAGMTPVHLIKDLAEGFGNLKFLDELIVSYQCDCSYERFRSSLLTINPQERESLFAEQQSLEIRCHFCNKLYYYEQHEL